MKIKEKDKQVRICSTIKEKTRDEVAKLASKEDRKFSPMVDILLKEAVEHRKKIKNNKL